MLSQRSIAARRMGCACLVTLLAAPLTGADRVRIAAERADGSCPADAAAPLAIVRLAAEGAAPASVSGCLVLVRLDGLSDAEIEAAVGRLAALRAAAAVVLELASGADTVRLVYAVKRLSSIFRSGSPDGKVALDLAEPLGPEAAEELAPYADALMLRPGRRAAAGESYRVWVEAEPAGPVSAVGAALAALASEPQASLVAVVAAGNPLSDRDAVALSRLQRYFTQDVSRDPTPTTYVKKDGSAAALRYYDAKSFAPILFLPEDPSGEARIGLSGGPFERASVENLSSGARRDFELRGAGALTLDLSKGSLAVVLRPAARPGGESRAAVEVGATRGLTAEEIIARERAWDAGQREKVLAYTALVDTSLRFRVAEFSGSLDLTIRGPYFFRRGQPSDWAWQEFFLNGVKWKGRTIPKLPILQPEKVTTLPLDVRLSEEYDYELAGETRIDGRDAYRVVFRPRSTVGARPIYRGTAWIDRETFALLRRESVQLNLKGDTLSNVQTEFYRAVRGAEGVVLPLEIRGEQVFSTAGRTTAIERHVVLSEVVLNPPDFSSRLKEAYASRMQMVRDTDEGLRYLVPDPQAPGARLVETKLKRRSLFGLAGAFYQTGQDFPFPLLGVQYFDFDLWGKDKQLSVFFGGALLFANYTDPSLLGSRFDLGADVFGVALPFTETNYRSGKEVTSERIKHLPEFFQVNIGHPFGPYLKASLGLFAQWDNYQRDKDTGPRFVTPVDTFTSGAELRLAWNQDGYNLAVKGSYLARANWQPWGDPATSGYDPKQKDYWRYSAELTKGFYFSGFRKLSVDVAYLDGVRLDRFSQWDFGPFGATPIRGFSSGSLRADRAYLANLSYGLNVENIVRFEVLYDQAVVTQKLSGYSNAYFSGVGLRSAFNGPWDNTRIRAEVGYPVIAHGVKGFTINAQILKLF